VIISINSFTDAIDRKFMGGCLVQNGKALFAPRDYPRICLFNPQTNLIEEGPAIPIPGTDKFSDAVALPDGRVALVPRQYNFIGLYTPLTGGQGFPAETLGCQYLNAM
jgi:hypothetical protein